MVVATADDSLDKEGEKQRCCFLPPPPLSCCSDERPPKLLANQHRLYQESSLFLCFLVNDHYQFAMHYAIHCSADAQLNAFFASN